MRPSKNDTLSIVTLGMIPFFFCSACLSSEEKSPPPCLDGVYEVELVEANPGWSCPNVPADFEYAKGWKFTIEPYSWSHDYERSPRECSETVARALTVLPRPTFDSAGAIQVKSEAIAPELGCSLASWLSIDFPYEYANLASAASAGEVVVEVTTLPFGEDCPEMGAKNGCTEYYTAKFTRLRADEP